MHHPLCFETICVKGRQLINLSYHQARLNKTRFELFGFKDPWDLSRLLSVPDYVTDALYKCRLAYAESVDNIQWEPYQVRTISSIKKVYDNDIRYDYKYNNRDNLNALYKQKNDASEILLIKNGMVTDSNFCNVAFLQNGKWYTPDTPLLPGTQRAYLLDSGRVEEAAISENDIPQFSHIRLFNAMVDWESAPVLEINAIR